MSFTKSTSIRDAVQEMWDSVHISWDEAWAEYLDSKCILDDTQIYSSIMTHVNLFKSVLLTLDFLRSMIIVVRTNFP